MTEKTKKRLAFENVLTKERSDDVIKQRVRDEIGYPEENARCRKIIASICAVLQAAGYQLDADALAEFIEYNDRVEKIKREVKEVKGDGR